MISCPTIYSNVSCIVLYFPTIISFLLRIWSVFGFHRDL
uniref:Uncharacterized protein n=1 Tax=Arundo donax TaxID=35708 RepID=A0A0A8Y555_ARUDO